MTKRTVITIIVLAVIAAIYFWDAARKKEQEEQEKAEKAISVLKKDEIESVRLERANNVLSFKKGEGTGDWSIGTEEEGTVKSDKYEIDNLVAAIAEVEKIEDIGAISDLSKFGLVPPLIKITARANGREQIFRIGKKAASGDGVYLMKDDDKTVYVASLSILSSSDKSLYDFRDKSLLSFESDEITALSIYTKNKEITLKRKDKSEWIFKSEKEFTADSEKVNNLLNDLKNAEVREFIPSSKINSSEIGLDNPKMIIKLKKEDGSELKLETGNSKKGLKEAEKAADSVKENVGIYARSSASSSIVLIDAKTTEKIGVDIGAWRSKKIINVRFDAINDTQISSPSGDVKFKRLNKENFQIYYPEEVKTNHWQCNTLNSRIADIKTDRFIKPERSILKKAAFEKPYAVIEIKTGSNELNPNITEENYKIVIGASSKEKDQEARYVKVEQIKDELFVVSEDLLKEVLKNSFDLRDKTLIDIINSEVDSYSIKTKMNNEPVEILIEQTENKWEVSEPDELEDKDVDDIVWDIIGLQMEGTAKEKPGLADYGLGKSFAEITLNLKNGKEMWIKIGDYIPGDAKDKNYIQIQGDKTVYIVSSTLRRSIEGLVHKE